MVHMRNGREVYPSSMALESFKVTMGTEIGVDEYSSSKTYAVGDYCIYTNTIYKCKTAITTPEAFNSSKWDATSIANELMSTNRDLSNLVKSTIVSGTTTATGALAIPNELKSKPLIDLHYDSANGLVFRRDNDYLTCLALSLQPFSNTSVSITVWYLDV